MRRVGRVLSLLISFIALQFSLVSGGPACMAGAAEIAGAPAVMGAMSATTAFAATGDHCARPHRGPRTPTPADQHCASMIVCVFAVDAPTSVTLAAGPSRVLSCVDGISERTPMSDVAAPELPPPRV